MENSSSIFSRPASDYEIMSRVDNDIYFEIELLCDGVKNNLSQLRNWEVDVLINTYMHQCLFLVEHVLNYVRQERKTTVHMVKEADENTRAVYRMVHLKELETSHTNIKEVFTRFEEAVSFIYPGETYPTRLLGLKSKMELIDTAMNDLFLLERTKLIRQKIKALPNALKFESNVMN